MVYIPAGLEPLVRRWTGNFQQASRLLEQLNQEGRERLGKAKARKSARPASSKVSGHPAKPKAPRTPS